MDIDTFWRRVDKSGGPDACWPWTGALNDHGYGVLRVVGGAFVRAHRHAYALTGHELPDELRLDHTCHNDSGCTGYRKGCPHRRCCNPRHHEPVTAMINNRRGNRYKRKVA